MPDIKHSKTNNITDWTQPELDTIIAGGAAPLPPVGTVLNDVTLPSDWNAPLVLTGATAGEVLFSSASGLDSDPANFFYEKPSKRLGIGTNTPDGNLHVVGSAAVSPNPTGTLTAAATDVGSGFYTNSTYSHTYRAYTYRVDFGATIYSSGYIEGSFTDDGLSDTTYNVLVTLSDALPAGADGYRIFIFDDYNSWNYDHYIFTTGTTITDEGSATAGTPDSEAQVTARAIIESADVRLITSGVTEAIWDASNKSLGLGTATPEEKLHIKGANATRPPNPAASMSIGEVMGYNDPYERNGRTTTYRAYCYKSVGGKYILSSSYLESSYTDDNSGGFYSLEVTFDNPPPSGADGYLVISSNLGFILTSYWLCSEVGFIDGNDVPNSDFKVTSGLGTQEVRMENTNMRFVSGGVETLYIDASTGNLSRVALQAQTAASTPLLVTLSSGQTANAITVRNSSLSNRFTVDPNGTINTQGQVIAQGAITTASTLSVGNTSIFTGSATFSSAVTCSNTLTVQSTATFNGTTTTKTLGVSPSSTGSLGVNITALAGQTGDLFRVSNSAATTMVNITSAGALRVTQNSVASTPMLTTTGSWFTGGTATTTKPHVLIEASGATSTGWSTSGTGFGVNAASGFTGRLVDLQLNGASRFTVGFSGKLGLDATNTAAGTTGAQTINKPSGTVNFAAAATSLVVTNSLVTTSSIVLCVVRTNDTTATIKNVVPAAGSFTINLGAAATTETSVGFIVHN